MSSVEAPAGHIRLREHTAQDGLVFVRLHEVDENWPVLRKKVVLDVQMNSRTVPATVYIMAQGYPPGRPAPEKVGILRDLSAVLPLVVQEKILVREVPLALQPVLQFLEYLLG